MTKKAIGLIIAAVGAALFVYAQFVFDTTTHLEYDKRIHNLRLLQDQQHMILLAVVLVGVGLVVFFLARESHEAESDMEKRPIPTHVVLLSFLGGVAAVIFLAGVAMQGLPNSCERDKEIVAQAMQIYLESILEGSKGALVTGGAEMIAALNKARISCANPSLTADEIIHDKLLRQTK